MIREYIKTAAVICAALAAVAFLLWLLVTGMYAINNQPSDSNQWESIADTSSGAMINKTYDNETGVACYYFSTSSQAISCVKVK